MFNLLSIGEKEGSGFDVLRKAAASAIYVPPTLPRSGDTMDDGQRAISTNGEDLGDL